MRSNLLTKSPAPHMPRGFTLVELLVTISIIVILASITVAGFTKYTKQAKLTASVQKVRDLGVLVMSYASEKGELPVWHDYNEGKYWWQLIADENGFTDPEIFKSPGDSGFDRENPGQTISYGWNYPVIGRHKGDGGFETDHVLRMNNFVYPERTLILADGPKSNCYGYIDGYDNKPDPDRYGGKAAAVFLDGSARVMNTPEEFLPESKWFVPLKEMTRK